MNTEICKITHRLTHFDRDTFTMHAFAEWPDVPSPLVFSFTAPPEKETKRKGGNGKATTLAITWLQDVGALRRVPDKPSQ